jgi:hypothetical protein
MRSHCFGRTLFPSRPKYWLTRAEHLAAIGYTILRGHRILVCSASPSPSAVRFVYRQVRISWFHKIPS